LFGVLNTWRDDELRGRLQAIFIAPDAGAPMQSIQSSYCEPGKGLCRDRYAQGRGHWIKTDGCEVTLVRAEDIERASRRGPVPFMQGQHRRNLVVAGIPIEAYRRARVRIGSALLRFDRLRPPCGYLDRLLQPGAAKALGRSAGIGLRVLEAGEIRVGDPVLILPPETDRTP
jgi:MOSC domain-containing protein YiiM